MVTTHKNFTFWLLRVGFAMCFVGHGVFGLLQKRDWLPFFSAFGIGEDAALMLMPLVGSVDIALGLAVLVWPVRAMFAYGAFWAFFTAALRPLVGLSAGELFERAGNYGVAIALLALTAGFAWFERVRAVEGTPARREIVAKICAWTTAVLLAGHGWLAILGKPLLAHHLSLVGLDASALPVFGAIELALAAACLVFPSSYLFAGIVVWKVASEALFIAAGAPVWEFIERGGSYVAPLMAAGLISRSVAVSSARRKVAKAAALTVAASLGSVAVFAQTPAAPSLPTIDAALLAEMRNGGYNVLCRHAITSHAREDRQVVLDDPSTQRVLSPEGEAQATKLGADLKLLKIPFGELLSSPYDRTRRSVLLMFDRVEHADALSHDALERGKEAELKALVAKPVAAGTNRLLMTHIALIYRSVPTLKRGTVSEGDCIVIRPGDASAAVAHVKPGDWIKAGG